MCIVRTSTEGRFIKSYVNLKFFTCRKTLSGMKGESTMSKQVDKPSHFIFDRDVIIKSYWLKHMYATK